VIEVQEQLDIKLRPNLQIRQENPSPRENSVKITQRNSKNFQGYQNKTHIFIDTLDILDILEFHCMSFLLLPDNLFVDPIIGKNQSHSTSQPTRVKLNCHLLGIIASRKNDESNHPAALCVHAPINGGNTITAFLATASSRIRDARLSTPTSAAVATPVCSIKGNKVRVICSIQA
jgi:hypothetical protein